MSKKRPDHLTPLPTVTRAYSGNQHLNTLAGRLIDVIDEFSAQMDQQGLFCTYAEIVGNLEFVKQAMMDRTKRGCSCKS